MAGVLVSCVVMVVSVLGWHGCWRPVLAWWLAWSCTVDSRLLVCWLFGYIHNRIC